MKELPDDVLAELDRRPLEALPVSLSDPVHSHYDPSTNRFERHEHPHGGAHSHALRAVVRGGGLEGRVVTVYGPGNYSPKAAR